MCTAAKKSSEKYIGVDVGGTNTTFALADENKKILKKIEIKTNTECSFQEIMKVFSDNIHLLAEKAAIPWPEITAAAFGFPGPLNLEEGKTERVVTLDWQNEPIESAVSSIMGEVPFYIQNDANLAALAEATSGAAEDAENVVYITVSTGVGSGLIIGGEIYSGKKGFAGEIGHMTVAPAGYTCRCGNSGCLEAMASGTALTRKAEEKINRGVPTMIADYLPEDNTRPSGEMITIAAREGDQLALDLFHEIGSYLGIAISNVINFISPDYIVIGGGVSKAGDLLFNPIKKEISYRALPSSSDYTEIVQADYQEEAGIIGAIELCLKNKQKRQ